MRLRVVDKPIVIDDFLDEKSLYWIHNDMSVVGWRFGQRSVPETNYPMWYSLKYTRDWGDDKEPNVFYKSVTDKFCRVINDYYGEQVRIRRVMTCGNTYGQEGDIHRDRQEPGCYTGVIHLTENFKPHWGGETVIYTDPITTAEYKYNRLVMFPSEIPHIGRAPIRQCGALRIVLSITADVIDA